MNRVTANEAKSVVRRINERIKARREREKLEEEKFCKRFFRIGCVLPSILIVAVMTVAIVLSRDEWFEWIGSIFAIGIPVWFVMMIIFARHRELPASPKSLENQVTQDERKLLYDFARDRRWFLDQKDRTELRVVEGFSRRQRFFKDPQLLPFMEIFKRIEGGDFSREDEPLEGQVARKQREIPKHSPRFQEQKRGVNSEMDEIEPLEDHRSEPPKQERSRPPLPQIKGEVLFPHRPIPIHNVNPTRDSQSLDEASEILCDSPRKPTGKPPAFEKGDELSKDVELEISTERETREMTRRDPREKQLCIEAHGTKCAACGFDFGEVYGDLGLDYIECHHLKPIANEDGPVRVVNPVRDLRPVCSNCHSMVHLRNPPLSIEELVEILQRQKGRESEIEPEEIKENEDLDEDGPLDFEQF